MSEKLHGNISIVPGIERAVLPLLLLQEMEREPAHGYALAGRLEERGFARVKGPVLYPALAKLEEAGLAQATWTEGEGGPGRKVYHPTPAGHVALKTLTAEYEMLTARVTGRDE